MDELEKKDLVIGLLQAYCEDTGHKLAVNDPFIQLLEKNNWLKDAERYIIRLKEKHEEAKI